jgi:hypothetical protein
MSFSTGLPGPKTHQYIQNLFEQGHSLFLLCGPIAELRTFFNELAQQSPALP